MKNQKFSNKRIVICADGTGNKGGSTPDTNVYKLYRAIAINHSKEKQITFYDNGVGTHTNKILRAVAGAAGFGFKRNVQDAYYFLSKNYARGDEIYMFGFSRGAATIRALNGFISKVGLVDGRKMGHKDLSNHVKSAMKIYSGQLKSAELILHENVPDIQFIGVWDTVSALGFPQRSDVTSLGLWFLNYLFSLFDRIVDFWKFKHHFYNYELTSNIKNAYQALAIDDARTSFWPMIWNENTPEAKNIDKVEQVWFAGMHSNVGGGYPRFGLADVSLDWMMSKTGPLKYKEGAIEQISQDRNANGRMYDSRHGFAMYYRYHPRDLQMLCEGKLANLTSGPSLIKIHQSVEERLKNKTANYVPVLLPSLFSWAPNNSTGETRVIDLSKNCNWFEASRACQRWIFRRKWLYGLFLEYSLIILACILCFRNVPIVGERTGINGYIANILDSILPSIFKGSIEVAVAQNPIFSAAAFLLFVAYLWMRKFFKRKTVKHGEIMRRQLLNLQKLQSNSGSQ